MSARIARRAAEHARLAIDTEFVSERRYQALLCLAQVAVPDPAAPDGVHTEVLDPLDELDPAPLAEVLADPAVEVVVHAGRQDVAILRRTWGTEVRNVFDTQIAAGFLGLGSQEGYESLVRRVLKVQLSGSEGFTRWERRPLSEEQLTYARDDARCLLALGEELERRLAEAGRLDWAREESAGLERSSDERDPGRIYERLPRLARLDPIQRAIALEVTEWRERTARRLDRPPGFVLPDHVVVELARRMPADRAALEHLRGLPQQTLHRRAGELLQAVRLGAEREPPPPPPEPPRRDARDAPLVALGQSLVRQRSIETGVAAELIATQADVAELVAALRHGEEADALRVTVGWRGELVGDDLVELMGGRRALAVREGRLELSEPDT